ncbi:MAG: Proteasome subunit [Candidatus Saccharibacteria bacterium]|nr:Proteasome subunit [Candidatus Saccharibacteria bacterium]
MTLVIACKSKDGIVIASDGKASRSYPGLNRATETIENAQKIYNYEKCSILPYGDGLEDYHTFLEGFAESLNGTIDYESSIEKLQNYLSEEYMFLPPGVQFIGIILAGIDKDGNQQINAFMSNTGYIPRSSDKAYIHGGYTKIAYEIFDEVVGKDSLKDTAEVIQLAKRAISETAKAFTAHVNNNITVKLITSNGIISL